VLNSPSTRTSGAVCATTYTVPAPRAAASRSRRWTVVATEARASPAVSTLDGRVSGSTTAAGRDGVASSSWPASPGDAAVSSCSSFMMTVAAVSSASIEPDSRSASIGVPDSTKPGSRTRMGSGSLGACAAGAGGSVTCAGAEAAMLSRWIWYSTSAGSSSVARATWRSGAAGPANTWLSTATAAGGMASS
jgi:hypothetical protein